MILLKTCVLNKLSCSQWQGKFSQNYFNETREYYFPFNIDKKLNEHFSLPFRFTPFRKFLKWQMASLKRNKYQFSGELFISMSCVSRPNFVEVKQTPTPRFALFHLKSTKLFSIILHFVNLIELATLWLSAPELSRSLLW